MTIYLNLNAARLASSALPMATGWLLADCAEARGKQDLWTRQKPEALAALRELAVIQSVESSNRIEGVTIPAARLRPLVLGRVKPKDRPEEELSGYRRALHWIFTRKKPVPVTPDVIRRLHALAQGGSTGDAGEWKRRDNDIVEILPNGERRVRFVPTPARQTPAAMAALCGAHAQACTDSRVPPLLLTATFVFDFLCIHPFRDGNGRVSRLLTSLLLQSAGFQVARYISLERLVEESKAEYYGALETSSQEWHRGRNDILPWWNYTLGIVKSGYREFEAQIEAVSVRPPKSNLTERAILAQPGEFTLAELAAQVPGVSLQLVKKVLSELKEKGRVQLAGRGRGAVWALR